MALVLATSSFAEQNTAAASVTPTEPSGASNGDRLVAVVHGADDNQGPEVATGWSERLRATNVADSPGLMVCDILRGGSAPNLTFGLDGHGANAEGLAGVLRFTGAAASPIGNSNTDDDASAIPVCPSISVSAGSIVLFAYTMNGARLSAEDGGYPTGTTGIYNREDVGGVTAGLAWQAYASGGSTGTKDFSANVDSSAGWLSLSIEILEAAAVADTIAALLLP